MRALWAAAGVLIAVVLAAETSAAPAPGTCQPQRPTRTKLVSPEVRVYKMHAGGRSHGDVYACSYATGRRIKLGSDGAWFPDFEYVAPLRVAGDLVAFGFSCACREQHRTGSELEVVDTNPRRRLVKYHDRSWAAPTDLVLRADGAVAAIGERYSNQTHVGAPYTGEFSRDVWKHDGAGAGVIDSSPNIERDSLELTGDTLSWVRDGMRHEYKFVAP